MASLTTTGRIVLASLQSVDVSVRSTHARILRPLQSQLTLQERSLKEQESAKYCKHPHQEKQHYMADRVLNTATLAHSLEDSWLPSVVSSTSRPQGWPESPVYLNQRMSGAELNLPQSSGADASAPAASFCRDRPLAEKHSADSEEESHGREGGVWVSSTETGQAQCGDDGGFRVQELGEADSAEATEGGRADSAKTKADVGGAGGTGVDLRRRVSGGSGSGVWRRRRPLGRVVFLNWREWALGLGFGAALLGASLLAVKITRTASWGQSEPPAAVTAALFPTGMGSWAVQRGQRPPPDHLARPGVVELTETTFWTALRQRPTFVLFYAPRCPHCQTMGEVWQQLPELLDDLGFNVQVASIDATSSPTVMDALEINTVPTLMLFSEDTLLGRHRGPRDVNSLLAFVKKTLP